MSSTAGRGVRVIAGAGIITYSSLGMAGAESYAVAAFGALPIIPLSGKQVRSAL